MCFLYLLNIIRDGFEYSFHPAISRHTRSGSLKNENSGTKNYQTQNLIYSTDVFVQVQQLWHIMLNYTTTKLHTTWDAFCMKVFIILHISVLLPSMHYLDKPTLYTELFLQIVSFYDREFCILNWIDSKFNSRKVKTIAGILRMDKEKGKNRQLLYIHFTPLPY